MNITKKAVFILTVGLGAALLLTPDAAHAVDFFDIPENPRNIGTDDIIRILVNVVKFGMLFSAGVAAIFVVINGYQYILSSGNQDKVQKAKQGLTWSIGGFILTISSFAIVLLAQETLRAKQPLSESTAPGIGSAIFGAPRSIEGRSGILFGIYDALLIFGAVVGIIFLIVGGYRYVTSSGNQDQVDAARKTILYTVIGLAVLFLSYNIVVLLTEAVQK